MTPATHSPKQVPAFVSPTPWSARPWFCRLPSRRMSNHLVCTCKFAAQPLRRFIRRHFQKIFWQQNLGDIRRSSPAAHWKLKANLVDSCPTLARINKPWDWGQSKYCLPLTWETARISIAGAGNTSKHQSTDQHRPHPQHLPVGSLTTQSIPLMISFQRNLPHWTLAWQHIISQQHGLHITSPSSAGKEQCHHVFPLVCPRLSQPILLQRNGSCPQISPHQPA